MKKNKTSIVFTGDIGFDRYMDRKWEEAGGIGIFGVSYMAECIPATATSPGIFRWDDMDCCN